MAKKQGKITWLLLLSTVLLIIPLGCQSAPSPTPTPVTYSVPELKYRLFDYFGESNVFWCDPDFYPVARAGQEEKNALEQFPNIRANQEEFTAILQRTGLPEQADYTNDQKLLIYRQHKLLTYGAEVTPAGNVYNFSILVGEGQGKRYEGTITPAGDINITKETISFNTCPICLSRGTLIDTPDGPVPVEQLHEGMVVWTADSSGNRVPAVIIKTSQTPVPSPFHMVRIGLSDGRSVTASPGHPSTAGKPLGEYRVGEVLYGARVTAVGTVDYSGNFTYDILPSGGTGIYRANGIPLLSTLSP